MVCGASVCRKPHPFAPAQEACDIATAFVDALARAINIDFPKIKDVIPRMVNASFWMRGFKTQHLVLSHMQRWCQKEEGLNCFYNCDTSPAMKITFEGIARVTVYSSGNVQMKAMKQFDTVGEVHAKTIKALSGYLASL